MLPARLGQVAGRRLDQARAGRGSSPGTAARCDVRSSRRRPAPSAAGLVEVAVGAGEVACPYSTDGDHLGQPDLLGGAPGLLEHPARLVAVAGHPSWCASFTSSCGTSSRMPTSRTSAIASALPALAPARSRRAAAARSPSELSAKPMPQRSPIARKPASASRSSASATLGALPEVEPHLRGHHLWRSPAATGPGRSNSAASRAKLAARRGVCEDGGERADQPEHRVAGVRPGAEPLGRREPAPSPRRSAALPSIPFSAANGVRQRPVLRDPRRRQRERLRGPARRPRPGARAATSTSRAGRPARSRSARRRRRSRRAPRRAGCRARRPAGAATSSWSARAQVRLGARRPARAGSRRAPRRIRSVSPASASRSRPYSRMVSSIR